MIIKIQLQIAVLFLLTSLVCSGFQMHTPEAGHSNDPVEETETLELGNEVDQISARSTRTVKAESNIIGGSWLDNFDDDTAIDWTLSDSLDITKGGLRIRFRIIPKSIQFDNNTVGLWHFDEGFGTQVNDSTPLYNNGTLGGDGIGTDLPTWTTGILGSALLFDGVDDYIDVPDNESLRLSDAYSLVVWVKPISNGGQTWQTILEKGSDRYGLYMSGDNTFQVYNGGFNPISIKTSTFTMGEWCFLVATYDRNEGTRRIYLNGNEDASSTHSGVIGTSTQPLGINRHPSNGDSPFNGIIDEVAIYNRSLSAEEIGSMYGDRFHNRTANLTTKKITLPENMRWDTFFFNKTQAPNTYLNVTILNASSGQVIPGTQQFFDDGEFDISYIDPAKYPSIRLKATFVGNGSASSSLHSWGVSWQGEQGFRDTFFGGVKLEDSDGVVSVLGNGTLYREDQGGTLTGPRNGHITSIPVNLPPGMQWDSLIINKSEPLRNYLNVTILNASSDLPIDNYIKLRVTAVNLTSLDPHKYSAIKLHATFESDAVETPYVHDWAVTWTENEPPSINNLISGSNTMYRSNTTSLSIDVSDTGENKDRLTVKLEYKMEADPIWNDEFLSEPKYQNGLWNSGFTPPKNASLGYYSFRITCNDSFGEYTTKTYDKFINVQNNLPLKPALAEPANKSWIGESRPVLSWVFNDPDDGDYQTALEVKILDIFTITVYTSGQVQSMNNSFEIDQDIEDGAYHWQVRVSDNYGMWSDWSDEFEMNIDTKPPESPIEIMSPTHKNSDIWYSSDKAIFDWKQPEDDSGISGYSYVLDSFPDSVPSQNISMTGDEYVTNHNSTSYEGVVFEKILEGIWYFHIRAVDLLGKWSDTTTYSIKIDSVGPTVEDHTPANVTAGSTLDFKFEINDTYSGLNEATISWRYASDIDYQFDVLIEDDNGLYIMTHKVLLLPEKYIDYYIDVSDNSDPINQIRFPTSGYKRVDIQDLSPPVIEKVNYDERHNRYTNLRISITAKDNIVVREARIYFNDQDNYRVMKTEAGDTFSIEIDRTEFDFISGYKKENEILFKVMVLDHHNNSAVMPLDGNYNITLTEDIDTANGNVKKTEDKGSLNMILMVAIPMVAIITFVAIMLYLFIRRQSKYITEDRHKLRMAIADTSEITSYTIKPSAHIQGSDQYPSQLQAPEEAQEPISIEGTSPVAGYLPEATIQPTEEQVVQPDDTPPIQPDDALQPQTDDSQQLQPGEEAMAESGSEQAMEEQVISETEDPQSDENDEQRKKKPAGIKIDDDVIISLPEDSE